MSPLYNYFVTCWTMNPNFTVANLNNAVAKNYITTIEAQQIQTMTKAQ